MTDTTSDKPVHSPLVPDFRIQRFAGIKDLTVPPFGQVTLVVGDNGVGKSALLDALRVYARKGGRHSVEEGIIYLRTTVRGYPSSRQWWGPYRHLNKQYSSEFSRTRP